MSDFEYDFDFDFDFEGVYVELSERLPFKVTDGVVGQLRENFDEFQNKIEKSQWSRKYDIKPMSPEYREDLVSQNIHLKWYLSAVWPKVPELHEELRALLYLGVSE